MNLEIIKALPAILIFKYNKNTNNITGLTTWINSLKSVKSNVDELLPQYDRLHQKMEDTGLSANILANQYKGIDKAVVKYCSTTKLADQSQDGFKASLQQTTLAAKAQSIALKGLAIAGNMLAFMGIAKLLSLYSEYKQSQQELIQNTREAANSFNETTKSIQDYADRYKALHEELTNANTTEERQHEIKSDLLTLQKELNEKYGDEYGKLNLVTDAYKDQTAAILEMNKAAAQNYLTENRKGNEKAVEEMERDDRFYDFGSIGSIANDYTKNLFDIISKYEDKGIDLSPVNGGGGLEYTVSFRGDAAQADKVIHELSAEIQALELQYKDNYFIDEILDKMSNGLSKNKKILDNYQDSYNVTLKSEIQLNDELNDGYNKAEKSVKEYNEALTSGDETKILAARDNLTQVKQSIDLSSEQWKRYGSVINDVFSQADTGLYDFRDALDANTGNLMAFAKTLSGKSKEDLLSMADDGNPDYFDHLIEGAKKYGLSVDDVISELERLKIIEEDISSTGENVFKALTKEEVIANINSLSEGFESLDKIMKSISDKDNPFDYALLDDSKFKEKFSGLGDTYTNFIETISGSPKDISACQSAFDDLVTTWIDNSGVLENLTEENSELASAMLYNMGVTNAEEVVTSRLIAQQEHLAAQKAYTADMSYALANATAEEISGLIEEATQSDIAKVALAGLALEKVFFNDNPLDTSGDIENVIALVGVVGTACESLKALNTLKSGGNLGASIGGKEGYDAIVNMAQKEADEAIAAAANYKGKGSKSNYSGGTKTNKSSSGGGSKGSKGSKSKEPTEFDWMQRKINILDAQVDKLKTNIESLVGYKNKNSVTNTAIDVLIEKTSILQQMHNKYMEEAAKLGLSQNYIDKIQNGTIEIESIGDENLAKTIKEYQDLFEKAESANNQIIETQKSIKELNLSKLDNVIDQFSQLVDIQSQMIDTEKQLLDLREKSGEEIYSDDYISLAEKQLNLTRQNADAYHTLAAEMAQLNLQKGTEEWKKYNDQLQEYKKDMISAAEAVEEYKDAMTELAYKGLNDFKNNMDSINGTISTMNDLIGDSKLIDDFGSLTDRGMTQVALYAHQMTNAKQEATEYAEAIKSLDDALDSGLITQDEYNSMLQDYTASQESAVKSSKDARDAILSLVKEGIQAEIDAKKKLIDETKAALDAEKDLHDYQNSIAEKQDNISKLERQIAALSNSTNRDDIAQRLQLQSQLADAKKELYETQYDHEIEERKNALDKEYENFEESKQKESDKLDSNLDAQNAAISKYLDQVKSNYSTVYGVLTQYGDAYSLSAIEDLTTPWESGSEAANLCSDAIGEAVANIQYEINGLDFSPLYELVDLLNQVGIDGYGNSSAGYEDITNTGKWQKGQGGKWWFGEDYNPNGDYDYASDGIYTIKGKQYGFDDNGYMITGWNDAFDGWRYFEPENGEMVKSQWRKDSKGEWYYLDKDGIMATNMAVKAKEGEGYYYLDDEGKWDGQDLTSEQVRKLRYTIGYKKGTHNASKGLHLMDEEGIGSEAVITDKGVMKKFEGGEVVFNPKMADNLWNFAQDPTKFVSGLGNLNSHRLDFNKIQPIRSVTIDSPLVQIDGTGLSANEVATIIKNETRDIDKRVAKSIRYELMGK